MASDCDTTLETLASIVCEHLTLVEGCSDGVFVRLAECALKNHVHGRGARDRQPS